MIRIKQRIHWASRQTKVLAIGNDLKDACINWDYERTNSDDLYEVYKKSSYYNSALSFDEDCEMYNQFINNLTGEEMFEIMRDGTYTTYEEVNL